MPNEWQQMELLTFNLKQLVQCMVMSAVPAGAPTPARAGCTVLYCTVLYWSQQGHHLQLVLAVKWQLCVQIKTECGHSDTHMSHVRCHHRHRQCVQ